MSLPGEVITNDPEETHLIRIGSKVKERLEQLKDELPSGKSMDELLVYLLDQNLVVNTLKKLVCWNSRIRLCSFFRSQRTN